MCTKESPDGSCSVGRIINSQKMRIKDQQLLITRLEDLVVKSAMAMYSAAIAATKKHSNPQKDFEKFCNSINIDIKDIGK